MITLLAWTVIISTSSYRTAPNFETKKIECFHLEEDACRDFVDAMNTAHKRRVLQGETKE